MKKPHVFISYARSDYPFAHQLVEHLKRYKVKGWMDSADIAAGSAIASELRAALKASSAMVVLVSPDSLHSQWGNFKLGASAALVFPIIPILVGEEGGEIELPESLQGVKPLDARNRPVDVVARELESVLD